MGTLARLALIADELGETELAATYRENIKKAMEPWLAGRSWVVQRQGSGGNRFGINLIFLEQLVFFQKEKFGLKFSNKLHVVQLQWYR